MRLVVAGSAALAVLAALVALPACELGVEGPSSPETPDHDGGTSCPLPAPDGCTEEQCNTFGGCSFFSCDETTGMWLQTFCESPPAEVNGRWTIYRQVQADPCPEITRVDPLELVARPAIGGGEALSSLDGTELSLGEVHGGFATAEVIFGFDETWSAGDVSLPVRVSYDVRIWTPGTIEGQATASVVLGDRTCDYTLLLNGKRD
jgi:hypothetical protein